MKQINHRELEKVGIHLPMVRGLLEKHELGMDHSVAMDAQPTLVTTSSAGIPAFLTNYMDPEIIRILTTPNKAVSILGENKKGDWTTQTAMFPVVESTGEVSSYGDFNNNGSVGSNVNWVNRQSYLFQTVTQWGELELERAAEAKINYAQNLNIASTMVLDKFMNNCYFFGVAGLLNYGLLNDPSLSAPITPSTGVGGNTWALKTAAEIYSDIVLLYQQLVNQTQGLIDLDASMTLAMTPAVSVNLTKTNMYNVNVSDQIKKNFPNMKIETAVQYAVSGGNLVQLIADKIEGEDVGYCAFSDKLRAHPIKVDLSSFQQKKSSGTWGAIIRMPIGIAGMLGV
jgi:hypothetical protein